ncbi:MAG: hypothetical protein WKF71_11275 [Pyrinomonadaceae bacterium]
MKQSLYLETSVVGAYLDNGEPFRRDLTIRWWEHELSEYRVYSSILVQRELEQTERAAPHRLSEINRAARNARTRRRSCHFRRRLRFARHFSPQISCGRDSRRARLVS